MLGMKTFKNIDSSYFPLTKVPLFLLDYVATLNASH